MRCLVLIVGCALALCACSKKSDYDRMVNAARYENDHETASRLAKQLRETPEGIEAAISDLSVTGGRSKGMGSWMLITSSLATNVEVKLKGVLNSPQAGLSKRIEALWILWLRTHDLAYLELMFDLVHTPGDMVVGYGRCYLQKCFVAEADEIRSQLDVPENLPLSLTRDRFRQTLRKPGVLFHEPDAKPPSKGEGNVGATNQSLKVP